MTQDRTEEAALSGLLEIRMGGQPYTLPVLTMAQSEAWQRTLAQRLASIDVLPDLDDGGELMAQLFAAGGQAKLDVVAAYDLTGVLGGREAIRERITQMELAAALEVMVEAELPFGVVAAPSVVAAFGEPMRLAVATLVAIRSLSERSPSGPSLTGGLTGPPSGTDGPTSSSSSIGPTGSDGSSETLDTSETSSLTASTRATSRSA